MGGVIKLIMELKIMGIVKLDLNLGGSFYLEVLDRDMKTGGPTPQNDFKNCLKFSILLSKIF